MTILVIKTCDGDVYFSTARAASVSRGLGMAVEQVLRNDLARYGATDRQDVEAAIATGSRRKLEETLTDCGAVRRVEVNV